MQHGQATTSFPAPTVPPCGAARLFLFAVRRMAAAGVDDAHAANALLATFGRRYRRPLVLLRAMMLELARVSDRKIMVAPCCCSRMTADEARLLLAIKDSDRNPAAAYEELSTLIASPAGLGALTCLQAVSQSFADLGHPLDLYDVR